MTITMVGNHALNGVRGWLLLLCVSLTVPDAIEGVGRGLLRQLGTTGAVVQPDDQDVRVRPHDPARGNADLRGFVVEGQRTWRLRTVSHAFVSGTRLYFASAMFDQNRNDHPAVVQRFIESLKVPRP